MKCRTSYLRLFMLLLTALMITAGCGDQSLDDLSKKHLDDPKASRSMEKLNELSENIYQLALRDEFTKVSEQLTQLSILLGNSQFHHVSVEGLHAMTGSIVEAKRLVNAVQINPDKMKWAIAKIRYAADAMNHKLQPLWLQTYRMISDDIARLQQSIAAGNRTNAEQSFDELIMHYGTIEPAILISKEPAEMEKVRSLLFYIRGQMRYQPYPFEQLERGTDQLQLVTDQLFGKDKRDAFLPYVPPKQPIVWTFGLGSIIVSILAFVAWRKFKGQDTIVTVNKKGESL